MKRLIGTFLLIAGIVSMSIGVFLYWQRITPQRLSFNIQSIGKTQSQTGKSTPTVLVIQELGISLPVIPSKIQDGKWEATTKGVSYLSSSPPPGEVGNSILYGHNWKNILGNLTRARPGQEVTIFFSDGTKKVFTIAFTQVVSPTQTKILDASADNRVTLYTCTGFLDSKRFVVTAFLKNDNNLSSLN